MLHTTTALSLGLTRTLVTMFGGCPKWKGTEKTPHTKQKLADTTLLEFGEQKGIYALVALLHYR